MVSKAMRILAIPILVILLLGLACRSDSENSKESFPDLANYHGRKEDLLILEGRQVVPAALERIENKSTPHRTAIMFFLGNGEYKEALPVLRTIVDDKSDPHRGVALIAVFQIDELIGKRYATRYKNSEGRLGEVANDILQRKAYLLERRSYSEALRDYLSEKYF